MCLGVTSLDMCLELLLLTCAWELFLLTCAWELFLLTCAWSYLSWHVPGNYLSWHVPGSYFSWHVPGVTSPDMCQGITSFWHVPGSYWLLLVWLYEAVEPKNFRVVCLFSILFKFYKVKLLIGCCKLLKPNSVWNCLHLCVYKFKSV